MMPKYFSTESVVNFWGRQNLEKKVGVEEGVMDQIFKFSDEIFWYPGFPMGCEEFRYWFLGEWSKNCYYASTVTLDNYTQEFLGDILNLFSVVLNGHFNIWRIRKIARGRDVSCCYDDIGTFPKFREKC